MDSQPDNKPIDSTPVERNGLGQFEPKSPLEPKRAKKGGRPKGAVNKVTAYMELYTGLKKLGFDPVKEWKQAIEADEFDKANAIAKIFPHVAAKQVQRTYSESDVAIQQSKLNIEAAKKLMEKALEEQKGK